MHHWCKRTTRLGNLGQVFAQPAEQSLVSFRINRPDAADDIPTQQYCQKAKPDERDADQTAGGKVTILAGDQLVKIGRELVSLGADSTPTCLGRAASRVDR
jgi:hypothetical protein